MDRPLDLEHLKELMKTASPEMRQVKDAFVALSQAKDMNEKQMAFLGLVGTLKNLQGGQQNATDNI